jgi:hypothetical protein
MFLTQMVNTRKGGGIDLPPQSTQSEDIQTTTTTTSWDGSSQSSTSWSWSRSYIPDADIATDGRYHGRHARSDAAGTPRDVLGERGGTLGKEGATAASTTATTTTSTSTPGQAPGIYEPQAAYLRQLARSTRCWWLAEVSWKDAKHRSMLWPGEGSLCF